MRSRRSLFIYVLTAHGLSSVPGFAAEATYSLGSGELVTSIAGRSSSDLYFMRDRALFHFDGKRASKVSNPPVCVSTTGEGESMYPMNVDNEHAQVASLRYRSMKKEDPRFNVVDFTTLSNERNVIRVYGSGDYYDARGSSRYVTRAKLTPAGWHCEGRLEVNGSEIDELAFNSEAVFMLVTSSLSYDKTTYPFATVPSGVAGVTAEGLHGVWVWSAEDSTVLHLNSFTWDVRPIDAWQSVYRVQGAGSGKAWAIGVVSDARSKTTGEPRANALALWTGEEWKSIALPEGFVVQPKGLLVDSVDRIRLVGDGGRRYKYDAAGFTPENGPDITIAAAWRSPSKEWFLGGRCGNEACLVKLGGTR